MAWSIYVTFLRRQNSEGGKQISIFLRDLRDLWKRNDNSSRHIRELTE